MKANIIKRMLCGALALSLILAPSMGTLASSTAGGSVIGNTPAAPAAPAAPAVVYAGTSTVAGTRSTVGGVFLLQKGIAAAVTTPTANLAAAFGLAAGETPFVKAIDMDNKKSSNAYRCMTDTAAAYGGTIYGTLNVELGKMANGRYSLLDDALGTVDMTFSVPAAQQGGNVAVICVKTGGRVAVLEDTDPRPGVLAVALPTGASALAFIAY